MQLQTQPVQARFNPRANIPQFIPRRTKHQKVIAVTDIFAAPHLVHHFMIKAVQDHIGQKLTREIADGNTPRALQRGKEIVSPVPLQHWFLQRTAIDDEIEHTKDRSPMRVL